MYRMRCIFLCCLQGRLQLLICIEEDNGNRVATFEIEHNGTAAQPNDTELPEEAYNERDQNGAVLSISIYVQCNTGFYGPSCDCQNTNDSTGHYTCTREGGIQCLDGYQNPHNNCTECECDAVYDRYVMECTGVGIGATLYAFCCVYRELPHLTAHI